MEDPQALVAAFRDVPRPDVFGRCGFGVAVPADLEEPVTGDLLADLTGAERRDVTYHRPSRVGNNIFNWFD